MFGISGNEFIVLLLVLVVVVGPSRLPEYTAKLTQAIRKLRVFLEDTKAQIAEEVGPELGDLDLSDLNPRNYDPRKIVRDALGEDIDAIRKDLANPFQSVAKAAKESGQAVAGELGAATGKGKSLSQMIEDKAEESRQAKTAKGANDVKDAKDTAGDESTRGTDTQDTTKEPVPSEAATAMAEAQAVTAEIPQVEQEDNLEAGTDEAPESSPVSQGPEELTAEQGPEEAEPAALPVRTEDTPEQEVPEEVEDQERRLVLERVAEAAGEVMDAVGASVQAAETIPSTLVDGEETAVVRPVSPREILRAAKTAARTRPEAATATLEH